MTMTAMDHIAVNVRDIEAMVRFYTEVLQLKPERLDLYRSGEAPFPSVRISGDTIIDFFPPEMQEESGPLAPATRLNHVCLAMGKAEWDALRARLDQSGVPIDVGPVPRWGAHGSGISVYFRDPEGNTLEARHYPPGECGDAKTLTS